MKSTTRSRSLVKKSSKPLTKAQKAAKFIKANKKSLALGAGGSVIAGLLAHQLYRAKQGKPTVASYAKTTGSSVSAKLKELYSKMLGRDSSAPAQSGSGIKSRARAGMSMVKRNKGKIAGGSAAVGAAALAAILARKYYKKKKSGSKSASKSSPRRKSAYF